MSLVLFLEYTPTNLPGHESPTQACRSGNYAELLCHPDLNGYLRARGLRVLTRDHFDPRADLRYDMIEPVLTNEHGQSATLSDIGWGTRRRGVRRVSS